MKDNTESITIHEELGGDIVPRSHPYPHNEGRSHSALGARAKERYTPRRACEIQMAYLESGGLLDLPATVVDAIDEADAAFGITEPRADISVGDMIVERKPLTISEFIAGNPEYAEGAPLTSVFPSGITVTMLGDEVTGIEGEP